MVAILSSILMEMVSLMQTMSVMAATITKMPTPMGPPMHVTMMMTTMVWQMDLTNAQTHPLVLKSMQLDVRSPLGNRRTRGSAKMGRVLGSRTTIQRKATTRTTMVQVLQAAEAQGLGSNVMCPYQYRMERWLSKAMESPTTISYRPEGAVRTKSIWNGTSR